MTDKLICVLLKLAENGPNINKFFNSLLPLEHTFLPCRRGGLQTRCVQTSYVIDKLFRGLKYNYSNSLLTSTYFSENTKQIDSTTFSILNAISTEILEPDKDNIINIKLMFPATSRFPGHESNIIIRKKDDVNFDIFLIQSFIYTYKTKIFYTNNFDELFTYFENINKLFNTSNPKFTKADIPLYNLVFASDMVDYNNNSLIGENKSTFLPMYNYTLSNMDIFINSISNCGTSAYEYSNFDYSSFPDSYIDYYYYNIIYTKKVNKDLKIKIIKRFYTIMKNFFYDLLTLNECDEHLTLISEMTPIKQSMKQKNPLKNLGYKTKFFAGQLHNVKSPIFYSETIKPQLQKSLNSELMFLEADDKLLQEMFNSKQKTISQEKISEKKRLKRRYQQQEQQQPKIRHLVELKKSRKI